MLIFSLFQKQTKNVQRHLSLFPNQSQEWWPSSERQKITPFRRKVVKCLFVCYSFNKLFWRKFRQVFRINQKFRRTQKVFTPQSHKTDFYCISNSRMELNRSARESLHLFQMVFSTKETVIAFNRRFCRDLFDL